jgi:hypothetical protein
MDVERTMEFILDMQAKPKCGWPRPMDARMDKFDKRLEATRRLVEAGMKYVVKSRKDWDLRMKEMAELQKGTDLKFDRLIDSWAKQRTNGHKK